MSEAQFIYIADVFCPWCYAFGPIMKRLSDQFPEFPVKVYGGNLMSQPVSLREYAAQDPDLTNFWRQVEETSGRSLEGAISAVENDRDIRLYSPGADMILYALQKMAPGNDLEQMLMLEDLFYGQGLDLFEKSATRLIASRWSVDEGKLVQFINSGKDQEITENALAQASSLMNGIDSYPTVLLSRDNKVFAVSRGYVHYETVAQRLDDAIRDLDIQLDDGQFCSWHGNCAFGARKS